METDNQKRILIAGATGLIGSVLVNVLVDNGYKVVVLTRNKQRTDQWNGNKMVSSIKWFGSFTTWLAREVENSYGVINLAGENIATKRWSRRRRMQLIRSRLGTTYALAKACHYATKKPSVFIQASATGYYPFNSNDTQTEDAKPGKGFLARLTNDWESVAKHEVPSETRLVLIRTGIVLSKNGGMIPKLALPVKLFAGGWFGSGKQYLPWIHISDEANAIVHLLQSHSTQGAVNLVAPQTITQKQLVITLAKKLNRIAWVPIPAFAIKLIFGQMGKEALLGGCRVDSSKLVESGYKFQYPTISDAIQDIFKKLPKP